MVISALRAWRFFAFDRLGYEDSAWFPPRSVGRLSDCLALFWNVDIASNYVGCLKWFASLHRMDHGLFDGPIRMQTKAFKKLTVSAMCGKLRVEMALLNQQVVNGIVNMADVFGDLAFVVIHLTAWSFLFRVQSEVLPLEVGSADEFIGFVVLWASFGGCGQGGQAVQQGHL